MVNEGYGYEIPPEEVIPNAEGVEGHQSPVTWELAQQAMRTGGTVVIQDIPSHLRNRNPEQNARQTEGHSRVGRLIRRLLGR